MNNIMKNIMTCVVRTSSPSSGSSKGECRCHSTDYEKVMTSSNSAYGVVSASDDHEYEVIGQPQMDTHHMSTTGHSH